MSIPKFAICINNSHYPASLELHKVYRVIPDEDAEREGDLRVIDESGEDYLYSAKRFVPVELPLQVTRSVIRKVRESTKLANPRLQRTSRSRNKSK